jgi:hypothetical protein
VNGAARSALAADARSILTGKGFDVVTGEAATDGQARRAQAEATLAEIAANVLAHSVIRHDRQVPEATVTQAPSLAERLREARPRGTSPEAIRRTNGGCDVRGTVRLAGSTVSAWADLADEAVECDHTGRPLAVTVLVAAHQAGRHGKPATGCAACMAEEAAR